MIEHVEALTEMEKPLWPVLAAMVKYLQRKSASWMCKEVYFDAEMEASQAFTSRSLSCDSQTLPRYVKRICLPAAIGDLCQPCRSSPPSRT